MLRDSRAGWVFGVFLCAVLTASARAATLAMVTSKTDLAGNAGIPFTYQITTSGDTPVTYTVDKLPPGLALSGDTISGLPSDPGVTNANILATNPAGITATPLRFTIGPAIAPSITSSLALNGLVGVPLNYVITASGSQPLVFSATGLPPGMINPGGGTIAGTPTQSGSFAVPLTATYTSNGNVTSLTDHKTLNITIADLVPGFDTDGDCYPDDLEIALGSSPLSGASVPFQLPACGTQQLPQPRIAIKLNFAKGGADSITLNCSIPVPPGFSAPGQRVVLYIGGLIRTLTLGSGGTSKSIGTTVTLKAKPTLTGSNGKLSVNLKGNFAATLASSGLTGTTNLVKQQRSILLFVIVRDLAFSKTQDLIYTVKAGKTGSAK